MNIFRYMDFEKFVRLMITKSLYFPRLDELEDDFEGSQRIKITESEFREGALLQSSLRRLSTFVSCWTCLEGYPNYMWKEYAPGNGVAIKTTIGKLWNSLEIKPDTIGEVMYRNEDPNITPILEAYEGFGLRYSPALTDIHRIIAFNEYLNRVQPYQDLESGYLPRYDRDDMIGFEMSIRIIWPYMIKRTFYEDESEFRLAFSFGNNGLCNELSLEERYDLLSHTPYGFKVRLHTLDFIDEIKISPYADEDMELILKEISDGNIKSKFDNTHEDSSEYRYNHNDIHKMLYDRATFQQDPPDIPNIPKNEFESNVYVDNSGYLCKKSPQTYTNRGKVYCKKGEFDAAIQDFNTVINLNPKYADAYYNRGVVWLHLSEWEEAKADLRTAKELGIDIVASFHNDYESVADFEAQHGVKVPEDIAALLSRNGN